jgi:hypothetical protein
VAREKLASLQRQGWIRAGGDQRTWVVAKWSTAGVETVGGINRNYGRDMVALASGTRGEKIGGGPGGPRARQKQIRLIFQFYPNIQTCKLLNRYFHGSKIFET